MIIAADALETVEAARQRRSEIAKQIARSDQAINQSREVVERADDSLRRLSKSELKGRRPFNAPDPDLRTFDDRARRDRDTVTVKFR
jgi:hypothetical protein